MAFNRIIQILVPKETKFYPLFEQAALNLVECSKLLQQLIVAGDDYEKRTHFIKLIKEREDQGDVYTHTVFEELNKTFITPFDREDIHQLASSLDDVVDYMNGAGQRIKWFKPRNFSTEAVKLTDLIYQSCLEIQTAVNDLRHLKHPAKIKAACVRINEIENQADDLYHLAITELFELEKDPIELIKKKEIFQVLEKATDCAEDVSDVIKGIIIKFA